MADKTIPRFITVKDRYGMDMIINVSHIVSVIYVDEGVSEIKLDDGETRPSRTPLSEIFDMIK